MEQMLNTPQMQSLLANPDVMRSLISMNPQMKQLTESNPELGQLLNDPDFLQRSIEAFRNPAVMRELMRNSDRAMSNIESIPGGFSALKKMYEEVQAPMWAATTDLPPSEAPQVTYSNQTHAGPSAQPLPNPWSPAGVDPSGMAAMMQDPNMQRLMGAQFPGSTPLANPGFLANMFDPQTMSAMGQLEGAGNFNSAFAPFLNAANSNPEVRFRPQLQILKNMGFTDVPAAVRALTRSGGNVNQAVDLLLSETVNK